MMNLPEMLWSWWKNQFKIRKKEDRLPGIGQIGERFVEKLGWAYKATTYHLP
jgi:hypothetical protein